MDTLIANATIVTMNDRMDVLFGAYLGIEDGKISYIGKEAPPLPPGTVIDGTGMVLLPGLINCHTHLAASILRNFCDELSPSEALETQLQREDKMDSKCARAAATVAVAECLRFGVTSVSDLYYYPAATAEVIAESGMKANLALSAYRFIDASEEFDFETDEQCAELRRVAEKWNGYDGGRIRIDCGIFAEYTSNYKLWEGLVGYAAEQGLGFQLHLSESEQERDGCIERTGLAPAELLGCHGVWNVPAAAAGGGALTAEEMRLLGKKRASLVYCPISALKRALPEPDVPSCAKAGINVALGTDGCVESGSLDLWEAIRAAALSSRRSGTLLPASAVLMMATLCGARAQGRSAECGMLKPGMDADLVAVDFSAPHLIPCHNVLDGLVYCAKGGDVALTMVRGKILYRSGSFPTLNLAEAVNTLTSYAIPRVFTEPKA
ncbi:MAG: amidohydrolase family protein [Firmicutes bacterium]|nr:amidohydrolase family protein [Bacillota bacterium]